MAIPLNRRAVLGRGVLALISAVAAACGSDRATVTAPPFGQLEPPGTGTSPRAGAAGTIESVAVVGDSITVAAQPALDDGLRGLPLDVWSIDAAGGRRMTVGGQSNTSGRDVVARIAAADPPDLWVIALGSNDVLQYAGVDEYRNEMAALLHAVPERAPVVWVDTYLASDPDQSAEFNQTLRDTLAFRGHASVADWATVASADGMLSDGVHPSPDGRERFADVVTAAVDAWLGDR